MRTKTKVICLKLTDTEREVADSLVSRGCFKSRSEVFRAGFELICEKYMVLPQHLRQIDGERRIHAPRRARAPRPATIPPAGPTKPATSTGNTSKPLMEVFEGFETVHHRKK